MVESLVNHQKIVVADKDPSISRNISRSLEKMLSPRCYSVVGVDSKDRYGQEVRDPETAVVVVDLDFFEDNVSELQNLAHRKIPVFMTASDPSKIGNITSLGNEVPIAAYLTTKPTFHRDDPDANFFREAGERVEMIVHSLPRVRNTIGIIGVGRVGEALTNQVAMQLELLQAAMNPATESSSNHYPKEPVRLLLYNHGTRVGKLEQARRVALDDLAPKAAERVAEDLKRRGETKFEGRLPKLELSIVKDLDAVLNAGIVVLSFGNHDMELEARRDPETVEKKVAEMYRGYALATKEIYSRISPHTSVIHVTNPPEKGMSVGRLFLRKHSHSIDEKVEGFILNDWYRGIAKPREWGQKFNQEVQGTGLCDIVLSMLDLHHNYIGIIQMMINGRPLKWLRKILDDKSISNDTITRYIEKSWRQPLAANGHAATETATNLIQNIVSIVEDRDSHAAVYIKDPTQYQVFMGGSIYFRSAQMRVTKFLRKYFPNGFVCGVPITRIQRVPYPNKGVLDNAHLSQEEKSRFYGKLHKIRQDSIACAKGLYREGHEEFKEVPKFYGVSV